MKNDLPILDKQIDDYNVGKSMSILEGIFFVHLFWGSFLSLMAFESLFTMPIQELQSDTVIEQKLGHEVLNPEINEVAI